MQTEKKSFHCLFAFTCMADYSILHERVCYLLYKKNVELWVYVAHQILQQSTCHRVYVAHQILQQSTCHSHVLNYMSVQNLAQT